MRHEADDRIWQLIGASDVDDGIDEDRTLNDISTCHPAAARYEQAWEVVGTPLLNLLLTRLPLGMDRAPSSSAHAA
ncbi:hypothetical protein [Amycolatopsis sp. cmx-4-54]|uniref:hypothetical protein n=1 Tax=Amycolatopsis sp. cmx-4-54 TaxID=2790936 RepID=UPI00397A0996